MKVSLWTYFLSSLALIIVHGCAPKASDAVILEVGQTKTTLGEYERFFTRNTSGWDAGKSSTPEEREHFLDLLTNYKLKLQDAYDKNLHNDPEIEQELRDYRSSLVATFLIDKEVTEPGIQKLYERRKEEIRAQHILISLKNGASPRDTMSAWTKTMDVIKRINVGENFDSLVMQYSSDPTATTNHGDIYYFTSGQMMEGFENAAYGMKKGDVSSMPVRTQLGYHIIKIIDRNPSHGSLRARHIMARFKISETDSTDTVMTLNRIRALQDSLKKGWDFSKLAIKFSEDAGSAQQGGDLGWFERRRWVQAFDEACFTLSAGQTSDIVKTPFGYHIIHCDSVKPISSLSEMHEELKQQFQRFRYNDDYASYISRLKQQFHYSFLDSTFRKFLSQFDSIKSVSDSGWDGAISQEVRHMPMMMINNKPISVDAIISILNKRGEYHNTMIRRQDLQSPLDHIAESLLLDEQGVGLEAASPDFAALMKEYEQGVILFKAEQTEVWNNLAVSDSALRDYFSQNGSKFMFPERIEYSEIRVSSDTLAYVMYDSLTRGGNFDKLAATYNEDPDLKTKRGARGLKPINSDALTTLAATMNVGEISEPQESETGTFSIIKVTRREQPRQKTYEEAGAEISNAYQEFLSKQIEHQWVERIKQKYAVKQYKERLKDAFSSPQAFH